MQDITRTGSDRAVHATIGGAVLPNSMYQGRERRIHKVFVTRNTEYHLRRDRCVAVRDRRSGRWYEGHQALFCRVAGSLTFFEHGGLRVSESLPGVGECLCFDGSGLVTSKVIDILRPALRTVENYPN